MRLLSMVMLLLVGSPRLLRAGADEASPNFAEVYEAIRAHLAGANDSELNRAAVQGLISALAPKVSLVTNQSQPAESGVETSPLSKSSVFDEAIAYMRVERIGGGLAEALRDACARLGRTNQLKGLVLDLRYAGGADYAAAAATADLFAKQERLLLNWGAGMRQSKAKSDAISSRCRAGQPADGRGSRGPGGAGARARSRLHPGRQDRLRGHDCPGIPA